MQNDAADAANTDNTDKASQATDAAAGDGNGKAAATTDSTSADAATELSKAQAKIATLEAEALKNRDDKRTRETANRAKLQEQGAFKDLSEKQSDALKVQEVELEELRGLKGDADSWKQHLATQAEKLSKEDQALLEGLPAARQAELIARFSSGVDPAAAATVTDSRSQTLPAVTQAKTSSVQSADFASLEGDDLLTAMRENPDGFRKAVVASAPPVRLTTNQAATLARQKAAAK